MEATAMARTLLCPAGQWTVIFDHAFVQLPRTWTVEFVPQGGTPVGGEVIEKPSRWIFSQPPVQRELTPQMVFSRGWWNTFYWVGVKPITDVTAHIR
jgi:hypothetical protein